MAVQDMILCNAAIFRGPTRIWIATANCGVGCLPLIFSLFSESSEYQKSRLLRKRKVAIEFNEWK